MQKVRLMPRVNTAGFELTSVASGAWDGFISLNSRAKPWDLAAGTLIVQEAGGRVENIGTPGRHHYRNLDIVAANPGIFDDIMQFVVPLHQATRGQ
jgi:myo-inositol-1(or 4)-monophosphatase